MFENMLRITDARIDLRHNNQNENLSNGKPIVLNLRHFGDGREKVNVFRLCIEALETSAQFSPLHKRALVVVSESCVVRKFFQQYFACTVVVSRKHTREVSVAAGGRCGIAQVAKQGSFNIARKNFFTQKGS